MPDAPQPTHAVADGQIAALPDHVRNQIAAGEVVERPASIVRELVDNALDAGARQIQLDLEEGGVKLVRVTDDGSGMGPVDLAMAFVPHATSKLRTVEDLEHIASLGFRGEALASIGSVARCRILSCPRKRSGDAAPGHRIENVGGRLGAPVEAGGPVGTSIEVRDLFYNVPARRRFLKRPQTELARCLDVFQRLALAHVGVGFVATHDGRRVFDVEASMDLRDRVRRAFGAELADALEPVEGVDGDTVLRGFVAPPRFARRDTSRQMWFLNGRPLRDKILSRVLKESYRGFMEDVRQPVVFLNLALNPASVDVNVHPTKSEVRFREERRLFGFLVRALREGLARCDISTPGDTLLRSAARRGDWQAAHPTLPDPGVLQPQRPPAAGASDAPSVRAVPGRVFEPPPFGKPTVSGGAPGARPACDAPGADAQWQERDEFRGPFLQVARTYLLRAVPDGFEIVDQHALHERLTFDGLRRDVAAGKVEVQRMLVPELVELSRAEFELLAARFDELAAIGIELAAFGGHTVAVQGLPARLRRPDAEGIVRDVIAVLEETGRTPALEDVLEEVLHRAACRSSIMAGDELDESSIRALLERAAELENDQTCPHGRPTRVRFTVADLEKAFHRR